MTEAKVNGRLQSSLVSDCNLPFTFASVIYCHANLCLRLHITRVWLQSSVHFCLRHLLPCKSLLTFTHHSRLTAIFRSLLPPSSIAMQIFAYIHTSLVSDCNLPFTFASVIYCHANLCLRSHITRVWLQSSVHFCLRHLYESCSARHSCEGGA